jgi:hypothetical protein
MSYKSVNGKLVKTAKAFTNRSIIFQGETDWTAINWNTKMRDEGRKMFDKFVRDHKCSDKEAIGILVAAIGEMLGEDTKSDLNKNIVLLSSMAMYASVCMTPNETNELNKDHNYASVVILPGKLGYSARWVGTFKAKDDLSALGHTWGGLINVIRPIYNTDKDYAGYSDSYDKAVKMMETA